MTRMSDLCTVCGQPWASHTNMHHEYSKDGQLKDKQVPKTTSVIDLPLRLVLIKKGIVSAGELGDMEMMLRAQARGYPTDLPK